MPTSVMHLRHLVIPLSILVTHSLADGSEASSSGCLLYAVQPNDTGYNIAKSFGLDFPLINASNPQMVWEKIKIGEQLLIPTGYTTQPGIGVSPAPTCPRGPAIVQVTVTGSSPASYISPADSSAGSPAVPSPVLLADPLAEESAGAFPLASAPAPLTGIVYTLPTDGPAGALSAPAPSAPGTATQPTSSFAAPLATDAASPVAPAKQDTATAPLATDTTAATSSSAEAATTKAGTGPASAASGGAVAASSGCLAYIVVKGDTGHEVAQKHGVTLAQLNAQNPGIVWEKLQEDQLLVFPPTANGTSLIPRPDCRPPNILLPAAAPSKSSTAPAAVSPASGNSPPANAGLSPSDGGAEPISVITYIIPASTSCSTAKFPAECATAAQAAPYIVASFAQYGITSAAEQAALLSWMIYESAGFQYNRNHYPEPGRPGQGTRTMMMPAFVAEYAAGIEGLKAKVDGTTDPDELLELVMVDEYSFGSAAWFHSVKCDEGVKARLREGTDEGWESWLEVCVGTEVGGQGPQGRRAMYEKAREALGVAVAVA